MIYREEVRNLFSVPDDYYLAHCVSADFGMGRGIVVEFNKRFDMKHILQTKYPDYVNQFHRQKRMKVLCWSENIYKIAMPIIGCGLDGLEWDKVSRIIKFVFQDEDVEILVCRKE